MSGHESRRRHPRIEIDGSISVLDLNLFEWVDLCNVSEGGFQTLARTFPRQGDVHTFKAVVGRELHSMMATAVYVRATHVSERARWLAGWRASDDIQTARAIAALIASATDVNRILPDARWPTMASRSRAPRWNPASVRTWPSSSDVTSASACASVRSLEPSASSASPWSTRKDATFLISRERIRAED